MDSWQLNTPVVFIIFNRLKATQTVFEAIRQAKPRKLFVFSDGARAQKPGEAEVCKQVRAVINQVDWNCEVLTDYADYNLGCKKRVSSGLDWVFSQSEEAIILEDDCLPDPSFFRYCEALLAHYRQDERVMSICGLNVQFDRDRAVDKSYYFSRYSHIWGWATWRRAWQHYDVDMKVWPTVRDGGYLTHLFSNVRAVNYWTEILQATYEGKIDTWDYQWIFNCLIHNGLNVIPRRNLISNIGFGADATHTVNTSESTPYAAMKAAEMAFPLRHPEFLIPHLEADRFTQSSYYDCNMRMLARVQRRLKSLFRT